MKNVIIIHPGSLYIRIGRASDVNPVTLLHAVARKRYTGGASHVDPLLPQVLLKVRSVRDANQKIMTYENVRLLFYRIKIT